MLNALATAPRVEAMAYIAWIVFITTWWSAALWVSKATAKGSLGVRGVYLVAFTVGFAALFSFNLLSDEGLNGVLWREPCLVQWLLLAGEVVGFAFGWWARVHLGKLWSGMMTIREGHHVVDTGPYALVRHPIYTAFIGSSWAYALIVARPSALFGAIVLTAVMTIKGRDEEDFLRRELGKADYDVYAARVPMLVPFWPVRR